MPATKYVKFMRGTQALYNSLTTKDDDTLYFVYTTASADKGKLYLGNKLISGSSGVDGNISVSDIADVIINSNLSDGDVLVYSQTTHKWESTPITEAVGMDVFVGATTAEAGASGLVPAPNVADRTRYLRGDGTWSDVETTLSAADRAAIDGLEARVTTLIDTDVDKSVATIAAEQVAELLIPQNAKESLNTLQEIAQWIQDHPDDASQMSSDIQILQTQVGTLDDTINGTELDPDSGLVARVGALEDTVGTFTPVAAKYLDVGSAITYLDNSVTEINERLRWHELNEE